MQTSLLYRSLWKHCTTVQVGGDMSIPIHNIGTARTYIRKYQLYGECYGPYIWTNVFFQGKCDFDFVLAFENSYQEHWNWHIQNCGKIHMNSNYCFCTFKCLVLFILHCIGMRVYVNTVIYYHFPHLITIIYSSVNWYNKSLVCYSLVSKSVISLECKTLGSLLTFGTKKFDQCAKMDGFPK